MMDRDDQESGRRNRVGAVPRRTGAVCVGLTPRTVGVSRTRTRNPRRWARRVQRRHRAHELRETLGPIRADALLHQSVCSPSRVSPQTAIQCRHEGRGSSRPRPRGPGPFLVGSTSMTIPRSRTLPWKDRRSSASGSRHCRSRPSLWRCSRGRTLRRSCLSSLVHPLQPSPCGGQTQPPRERAAFSRAASILENLHVLGRERGMVLERQAGGYEADPCQGMRPHILSRSTCSGR